MAAARGYDPSAATRRRRNRAPVAERIAATLVLSLFGVPGASFAISLNGSDFQVSSYTTTGQYHPHVASDSSGNFVVVWQSLGSAGTDSYGYSVQGQRYNAGGSPNGGQFQVNSDTPGNQFYPSVASDPAGDFTVVWYNDSEIFVKGQRYGASGSPSGGEFQVGSYAPGSGVLSVVSSVASDSKGDFVVAWHSNGSPGNDTSDLSVQGERYSAGGAAIGGQFQVNTYTTSFQSSPDVASDANGNFVVVWESNGSAGTDASLTSIQGQRYAANGSAIGGQFQVNSYTSLTQLTPAVASDSKGNFIVVWGSDGSPGTDTSSYSIQGQRYNASGAALGAQFQVNTYTTGTQFYPSVASDSFGDFVVAWSSVSGTGPPATLEGQAFSASGAPIGSEFQVNTYTTGEAVQSSVASDSAGKNIVVVWSSAGGFSIRGQRFLPEPSRAQGLGAVLAMAVWLAHRRTAN